MNIATKLTLMRVVAIPFFMLAFFYRPAGAPIDGDWGKVIATIIFILASITDYYDGYLARRYKQETTFGKFMDPIADKILVTAALVSMVEYRSITFTASWVAVCILSREFAVTGLRLICATQGKVIDASGAGKIKTTTQLTAIITALSLLSLRIIFKSYSLDQHSAYLMQYYSIIIQTLMIIAAIASIYSGYDYFKKNWHFLDE